jgi:16S rRNA processing protein RimM
MRPHGLGGELRLKPYNLDSDLLERLPPIELQLADGTTRPSRLLAVRRVPNGLLAILADVDSRDEAEALRGAIVQVHRSALGDTEPDEFFVCDLVGCPALLEGEPIGVVDQVIAYPTCDALLVRRADGASLEVPLHEDFVGRVAPAEGVIELHTIEGLDWTP